VDGKGNWENYEKDIEQLREYRRVWVLFSHARTLTGDNEEKFFLYLLNKRAAKVDYFKSHGAAVYLYDFHGGDHRSEGPAPVLGAERGRPVASGHTGSGP
jgi:hypothetical protein